MTGIKNPGAETSLVAQWLGICLPIQGHKFDPWSKKIPHAAGQLSLHDRTTETVQGQLEKAHTQKQRPTAVKTQKTKKPTRAGGEQTDGETPSHYFLATDPGLLVSPLPNLKIGVTPLT